MLRALLWKQWREYRWILLTCTVAWIAFAWIALHFSEEGFIGLLMVPSLLLPCFIAAQVVAGERTAGTDRILASLPIRRLDLSILQVISGLLVLSLPMLLATVFLLYRSPSTSTIWGVSPVGYLSRPTSDELTQICTFMTSSAVLTYLWILNIAARFKSRGSVATAGAAILCSVFFFFILADNLLRSELPQYIWSWFSPLYLGGTAEGSSTGHTDRFQNKAIAVRTAVSIVLLATASLRLTQPARRASAKRPSDRPSKPLRPSRIPIGFVWLFWKACREILWLALWSMLIDLAASILLVLSNGTPYNREIIQDVFVTSAAFWFIIGSILMIALAVRMTGPDRQSAIEHFWRSRPIHPAALFWTKFLAGALVPIGVFLAIQFAEPHLDSAKFDGVEGLSNLALDMAAMQLCIYAFTFFVGTMLRNSFLTALTSCAAAITLYSFILTSADFSFTNAHIWQILLVSTALITLLTSFTWSTHFPLSAPQKT